MTLKSDSVVFSVIGCGVWGSNHIRVLSDMDYIKLDSIVDISDNIVKSIAEKYKVDYYNDPMKVFKDDKVEAVTICTPTITHYDLAKKAIESGKHVLVEKPMTNTVKEAEELIRLAEKNDVKLTVGFIERFNPAIQRAIEVIKKGIIGEVILAHTKRVSRWPERVGDVGVIKDLAIHDIDIVNQLFGVEAGTVFASAGNIRHTFEDYANIMMCFPRNKGAFIETNWLTKRKVRTLTVTGTEGLVNVDFITQTVSIEDEEGITQPFISNGEPLKHELESFRDSIRYGREPVITGKDGLKAMKVCESALQSSHLGKPVVNCSESCDWLGG